MQMHTCQVTFGVQHDHCQSKCRSRHEAQVGAQTCVYCGHLYFFAEALLMYDCVLVITIMSRMATIASSYTGRENELILTI